MSNRVIDIHLADELRRLNRPEPVEDVPRAQPWRPAAEILVQRVIDTNETAALNLEHHADALVEFAHKKKTEYYKRAEALRTEGRRHAEYVAAQADKLVRLDDLLRGD